MDVLDIFSWLPSKEISLEEIKDMVIELYKGGTGKDGFSLEKQLPAEADENIMAVQNELLGEGKQVCFLLRNGRTMAAIGYRNI